MRQTDERDSQPSDANPDGPAADVSLKHWQAVQKLYRDLVACAEMLNRPPIVDRIQFSTN